MELPTGNIHRHRRGGLVLIGGNADGESWYSRPFRKRRNGMAVLDFRLGVAKDSVRGRESFRCKETREVRVMAQRIHRVIMTAISAAASW